MEKLYEIYTGGAEDSFEVGKLLFEENSWQLYLTLDELGRDDSLLLIRKPTVTRLLDQSDYLAEIQRRRKMLTQKGLADPFKLEDKVTLIKSVGSFMDLLPGQVVSFVMKDEEEAEYGILKSKEGDALSFGQYPSGKYETFAGQISLAEVNRLEAFGGELILENDIVSGNI